MKKRVTRGLALSMSCMLAMSMMPLTAFAGEPREIEVVQEVKAAQEMQETSENQNTAGKTIQLGTAGIESPTEQAEDVEYVDNYDPSDPVTMKDSGVCYVPNDYIYYGKFEEQPLKWRVLDAKKANDGTTDGMFLLSENLLNKQMKFEASARNDNDGQEYPGDWQGSDAQAWLKYFAGDSANFTEQEQAMMLGVEKTDSPVYMDMGGLKFGEASLAVEDTVYKDPYYIMEFAKSVLTKDDKMFLLSPGELSSYVANRSASSQLKAVYAASGEGDNWWLRTRPETKNESSRASYVSSDGFVSYNDVNFYDFAIRPACNLNMDSVLLISAAENGKAASETGTMASVGDYEGNEWKLTLLDESRSFKAEMAEDSLGKMEAGYEEWKLGIKYNGASAGENEYVSALLCNENGDILFYGNLANNSADGTAEMTLPKDLAAGNYSLKVFSQQVNADKMTDYASSLIEIPLAVNKAPTKPTTPAEPAKPAAPTPAAPEVGAVIEDEVTNSIYEVTGSSSVEYSKPKEAKASVAIPASVTVGSKTYEVTSIAANAFKNNKKLKKVVIPAKINKIGKNAFRKCKNLKRVVIKTKKLKAKSIGANAFKNISPKAVIKVPKGKAKAYKKILRAKGLSKNAKVK